MAAITQLRGIRDEAVTFKGTPETTPAAPEPAATVAEPGPTDMTPQPSQAEFSPNPEPTAPGPAPISKKEADAQFEAAKGTFPVAAKTPEGWTEHYHGSPYDFENLSSDFTSYGEGTQNEGSGHYLTESPGIADWYQDQNSAGKGGYSYKVAVKDGDFIEFDKPVAEQSKAVQNTLNKYRVFNGIELWKENPGSSLTAKFALNRIENIVFDGDKKAVSKALNEDGLTGIKYLDGNHRSIGDGKKNVVVFNDADVKVTAKKKGLDGKWEPILTQPEPIKPVRQTPAQWGKSLEEQAAAFKAAKAAGSEEPVPSPAARNATAEAPPVDEPAPTATPGAAPTTEPTTPSEGDVVTRLTDSLTAAGKVRPEQDYLTSKARSERLAAAREALKTGGVAGYRRAMAQLAGEVPKADFEAVAPKFSADDMDELVNRVSNSPKLQGYETIGALQGLDKLMNGKLPAANELAKLGKVFDDKFLKAALSNRTTTQKGMNLFSQVWNLPRSIVSTLDASIPLRQGVFMVSRPEFYTSFGQMLKQMGSQKYFDATQEALRARPTFQLMDESGLAIHDKRMLETRPEQFRSDLAGKIPVFKHLHNISERGAEGFSNQLRADVFDRLHTQYKRVGIDLAEQPELAKRVANYINIATGRGKVPFDKVGTAVGDILFSPQLMSSRIQLVTLPAKIIAEKDPILRRNMMRDLVGFSSIAATVIALAKLNGAEVSNNPLSTDWGKIKVLSKGGAAGVAEMAPTLLGVGVQQFKGETRYDIFGGMQQYLHLAAVLAMNERTMTNGRTIEFGKGYKPETRASTFFRFLRSKESPAASFINDAMEGTDYIGNKFDLKNALVSRLIPFSAQDIVTGYSPDTNAGPGKTAPAAVQPPANTGTTEVPDWASDKPQEAVNPRLIDNKVAENLLVSTLGLTPTDAGIRTHANQKKYYELARGHGVSRPGHSPHEKGNAIDIAIPSDVSPDDIVKLMKDNGYDGVRVITKKHGTGAHWHIEWASLYD
jgi:hypothetical protein